MPETEKDRTSGEDEVTKRPGDDDFIELEDDSKFASELLASPPAPLAPDAPEPIAPSEPPVAPPVPAASEPPAAAPDEEAAVPVPQVPEITAPSTASAIRAALSEQPAVPVAPEPIAAPNAAASSVNTALEQTGSSDTVVADRTVSDAVQTVAEAIRAIAKNAGNEVNGGGTAPEDGGAASTEVSPDQTGTPAQPGAENQETTTPDTQKKKKRHLRVAGIPRAGSKVEGKVKNPERIVPSGDIENAVRLLKQRHGIEVDMPWLFSNVIEQREYRDRLFSPDMVELLYFLQRSDELAQTKDVKSYYEFQAKRDAYKAGIIPLVSLGEMLGLGEQDLVQLIADKEDPFTRKLCVEFAPGNGELSRVLVNARDKFLPVAIAELGITPKGKGHIKRETLEKFMRDAKFVAARNMSGIDRDIAAVDIVPQFLERVRRKHINGIEADICVSPDEFIKQTGFIPNSADLLTMVLAFDRIRDADAALMNMRILAKKYEDDSTSATKFLFGVLAPLSPTTDSMSQQEYVPSLKCFDQEQDFRGRWMNPVRAVAIYHMIKDLNSAGFLTKRLAEHPYEVYSVHCVVEKAKDLREKYQHLATFDFKDHDLNRLRDRVFGLNSEALIPDDEIVGFPEQHSLVLISGYITKPMDIEEFHKSDRES